MQAVLARAPERWYQIRVLRSCAPAPKVIDARRCRPPRARFALCLTSALLLGAAAARAADNDLSLYLLKNPSPITVCTRCDGTDPTKVATDASAQRRFARMTAALGLAFVPGFVEAAGSVGQAGFELGLSESASFLNLNADEWATSGTQASTSPPPLLSVTTLSLRKGLGGSFELGTHFSYLALSQIFAVGAQLRWSLLDGIDYAPDLAVRVWGTRLVGTAELGLTGLGADVLLSKSWAVGGSVRLQPYGQFGLALLHATSGVIDFTPGRENIKDPTAPDAAFHTVSLIDNRFNRAGLGLRLLAGSLLLGLEGTMAFGTVPIQHDSLADGSSAPTQTTKQYSATVRLGLGF